MFKRSHTVRQILCIAGIFLHTFPKHATAFHVRTNLHQPLVVHKQIKEQQIFHLDPLFWKNTLSCLGLKKDSNDGDYNSSTGTSTTITTIYKDDCFGFTTFIAGFAVQDYTFTGIFISLSLLADVLTRVGVLPPDPKRPEIVDRKVPGVIAILTLLLNAYFGLSVSSDSTTSVSIIDGMDLAMKVQLAICSFSIVTAFFDIRWRDRFDYPKDFL